MLRSDLIEIINQRNSWAFIGAGASVDAGFPTWKGLLDNIIDNLDKHFHDLIVNDNSFNNSMIKYNYPKCFSRIERFIGRDLLDSLVVKVISNVRRPGDIANILADYPFEGYITTNYDLLLESTLRENQEHGWSSIGNLGNEIKKISGDVSRVIWHIHGSIGLDRSKSHLLLTEEDYDKFYLEDNPFLNQLRGLLAHRRIVFIGFGFQDLEFKRLMKRIGLLSNPATPCFAFLSNISGAEHEDERIELLEKYNIDVIPYQVFGSSHEQLIDLLKVYGSLILRRSIKFGQPALPCPSYDPETTGLLVYNEFCLKKGVMVSEEILQALLRARILSLLNFHGSLTITDIIEDLNIRANLIRGHSSPSEISSEIEFVLKELVQSDLVLLDELDKGNFKVSLTTEGQKLISNQVATSERLSDQFSSSLESRALSYLPGNPEAVGRVAKAAQAFFKDCVQERALGVAMATYSWRTIFKDYHMVALLQVLPKFMTTYNK